jgi:hypothetical protein
MLLDQIAGYEDLDLPLEQLAKFAFLHFAIGSLPGKEPGQPARLGGRQRGVLPLAATRGPAAGVAVTSRKGRFALETTLKQAGFRPREAPVQEGTDIVAELADESRVEQARLAGRDRWARARQQRGGRIGRRGWRCSNAVREEQAILAGARAFRPHGHRGVDHRLGARRTGRPLEEQLRRITGDRCVIRWSSPTMSRSTRSRC